MGVYRPLLLLETKRTMSKPISRGSITILISERASAWDPTVVSAHCNLQASSFVPISLRPWRGTWVRGQVTRHCRPCAGRSGSATLGILFLVHIVRLESRWMSFAVVVDTGSLPTIG